VERERERERQRDRERGERGLCEECVLLLSRGLLDMGGFRLMLLCMGWDGMGWRQARWGEEEQGEQIAVLTGQS
jgi:hypothetical protein